MTRYIYIYTLQTSCIRWCIASLFVIHKIYPFKSLAYVVLHINWRMRLYFSVICPLECVLANKSGKMVVFIHLLNLSAWTFCWIIIMSLSSYLSNKPHNHFRPYTLPPVVLCLTSIWMSLGFRQLRMRIENPSCVWSCFRFGFLLFVWFYPLVESFWMHVVSLNYIWAVSG